LNIIYYDGDCAFCHFIIKIILKIDSNGKFKFSPLSLFEKNINEYPDSLILKLDKNIYFEGNAIIKIFEILNSKWIIVNYLLKLFPINFLNFTYKFISKNRKFFKIKNGKNCPIIPDHLKNRFILTK